MIYKFKRESQIAVKAKRLKDHFNNYVLEYGLNK